MVLTFVFAGRIINFLCTAREIGTWHGHPQLGDGPSSSWSVLNRGTSLCPGRIDFPSLAEMLRSWHALLYTTLPNYSILFNKFRVGETYSSMYSPCRGPSMDRQNPFSCALVERVKRWKGGQRANTVVWQTARQTVVRGQVKRNMFLRNRLLPIATGHFAMAGGLVTYSSDVDSTCPKIINVQICILFELW